MSIMSIVLTVLVSIITFAAGFVIAMKLGE